MLGYAIIFTVSMSFFIKWCEKQVSDEERILDKDVKFWSDPDKQKKLP